MVIKKLYLFPILFLIVGLISLNLFGKDQFINLSNIKKQNQVELIPNRLNTNSYEYICEVFTFTKTQNMQTLIYNIPEAYIHSIIVQIVTPHACVMNITLWDSLDREFQIFYASISQSSGEISTPFGTAVSGNYSFQFRVITENNLNIRICIKNTGIRCLYDKILVEEQGRFIFYEITCFSDGYFIQHDILLQGDHSYKFYISRVSSISIVLSNRGNICYNITDPNDIEFQIYKNNTLASIAGLNEFKFGTAIGGTYTIDIEIYCDIQWMNVAYVIIDDGQICNPPNNNNHTTLENYFWIPIEWGLFSVIVVGILVGAIFLIVLVNRKKSRIRIRIRE